MPRPVISDGSEPDSMLESAWKRVRKRKLPSRTSKDPVNLFKPTSRACMQATDHVSGILRHVPEEAAAVAKIYSKAAAQTAADAQIAVTATLVWHAPATCKGPLMTACQNSSERCVECPHAVLASHAIFASQQNHSIDAYRNEHRQQGHIDQMRLTCPTLLCWAALHATSQKLHRLREPGPTSMGRNNSCDGKAPVIMLLRRLSVSRPSAGET